MSNQPQGREEQILSLYRTSEYSTSEMADKLGVSQPTIYNHLKRLKLPTSHLPRRYRAAVKFDLNREERDKLADLAQQGLYVTEIALALGLTIGPVRRIYREMGFKTSTHKLLRPGARFRSLVVVRPAEPAIGKRGYLQTRSLVICDCGNESVVYNHALRCGNTGSCGCRIQRRNPDTNLIRVRCQIESGARQRGLTFSLNNDDVRLICSLPCAYCQKPGENKMKGRKSGRSTNEEVHTYNGIDRVDSALGYEARNIVPCCFWCNRAKSNTSLSAFLAWIARFGCEVTEDQIQGIAEQIALKLECQRKGQFVLPLVTI